MTGFAGGDAAVPSRGMQAFPEQLAGPLKGRISLGTRVGAVDGGGVTLADGTRLEADRVVVAVDGGSAAELVGDAPVPQHSTITTYFAAPEPPLDRGILLLDGDGRGPVNHLAVMDRVAPSYAPPGEHLVAASSVGPALDAGRFEAEAREQLRGWFGEGVRHWRVVRSYVIPRALPRTLPGAPMERRGPRRSDGVLVTGDFVEFGSIQGALVAGRRAAAEVLASGG